MVYLVGNTSWGYCFSPMPFESENKAKDYGRKMKKDGYWFDYRIIKNENKNHSSQLHR